MKPHILKQFLSICRHGSMSSASKELGIAQPALSKQILQLEYELQVQLFERHSRGVTLTKSGKILRTEAADLLRRIETIKTSIRAVDEDVTGHVVVAVIASLAPSIATELYPRLEGKHPGISLNIVDYSSEQAGSALLEQEADFAILPNAATDLPQVKSLPLFEESFHFVSKSLQQISGSTIRFSDAAKQPLVLPFHNHDLRRRLEDAARSNGVSINVKYETGSINVTGAMVEQGMVGSIVPTTHWLQSIASGRISAKLITDPTISRVHSLCWLQERQQSTAAKIVQNLLVVEIQSLVSAGKLSGKLL